MARKGQKLSQEQKEKMQAGRSNPGSGLAVLTAPKGSTKTVHVKVAKLRIPRTTPPDGVNAIVAAAIAPLIAQGVKVTRVGGTVKVYADAATVPADAAIPQSEE